MGRGKVREGGFVACAGEGRGGGVAGYLRSEAGRGWRRDFVHTEFQLTYCARVFRGRVFLSNVSAPIPEKTSQTDFVSAAH